MGMLIFLLWNFWTSRLVDWEIGRLAQPPWQIENGLRLAGFWWLGA